MRAKEILLVNDDGVDSEGLLILKNRVKDLGRITVVTPETERSGAGKAISTTLIPVKLKTLTDGTAAYAIGGSPADACLLALFKILKGLPNLVISGINLGPNLGVDDFLTSGTIGAALEAAIHGIPSIAVSYCIETIRDAEQRRQAMDKGDLEFCADLARETADFVLDHGMPRNVDLLSINVPVKPTSRTVEVTRLSHKGYTDIFNAKSDGYQIRGWFINDYPRDERGTDIHAVRENHHASLTPVRLNRAHEMPVVGDLGAFLDGKGYQMVV